MLINCKKPILIASYKYLYSLWLLTQVNTTRTHKNSFLGSAWGLVQPFVHVIIISYFFSFLLGQSRDKILLNLVSSLPFWTFLNTSLMTASLSLLNRDYIIRKCTVSRSLFPLSDVLVNVYSLLLSFISMYIAFSLFFPANFSFKVLLLPFVALPLIISVMATSIAVAYFTPYVRDIPQMLNVVLNALYWTLPIIYTYEMVPESKKFLFELNPLFWLFRPIQILLSHEIPSGLIILKSWLVTGFSALISYLIYRLCRRNVVFYL